MGVKHYYCYQGHQYTLNELTRISNLHRDTILRRLDMGWSIEDALETPAGEPIWTVRQEEYGKQVPIVFNSPLPVYESMQPVLGKEYIATLCGTPRSSGYLYSVFYVVQLENGKPLITYPGEFEEISLDTAAAK